MKNFKKTLLLFLMGIMILSGCDSAQKTENISPETKVEKTSYGESPALAKLVANGQLPPTDERLPKNPMLIQPVESVGKYGGTWHIGIKKVKDHAGFIRHIGYENLVRWDPAWTKVIPNIAQSFDANENSTEFTFRLREGMRWSDGEPFSADDIMFWYEDVFMNEKLHSEDNAWLFIKNQPVVVEKIDDYTVKFIFSSPYGLFLQSLATAIGAEPTSYPKHYLKQFHPKYNPDIDKLITEEGVTEWTELFKKKFGQWGYIDFSSRWQNPELPTLNAWVLKTVYGEGDETIAERNPYYWKIDLAGNQLPYIDQVYYYTKDNTDQILELALEGKLDMQNRHLTQSDYKIELDMKRDDGGYGYFETIASDMNTTLIQLNLTHKDPVKREIFQNKNFRIGLSHAINRIEIIREKLGTKGIPFQAGPRPESPLYDRELATQYTGYDVKKANEYLDKAGYTKRDSQGFRLGPDNKRISFTIDTLEQAVYGYDWKEILEMVSGYWKEVGIEMKVNTINRDQLYERKENNLHDAVVWGGDGGMDVVLQPRYYFPFNYESNYANLWYLWYTSGGQDGEMPPEATRKQMELYDQIKEEANQDKQNELMKQILEIAKDEFYIIGISLPGEGFGILKNNFRNIPKVMPYSWTYPTVAPTNPCQYFIE